ncbi:hypothetical protein KEM54_004718 [Ascosphaera aggregata]|nr:hypothetical protein KEM54_004718 [Ascosphaera aggregata]
MAFTTKLPGSILIVGGGVFGLSTAVALQSRNYHGNITIVEAGPIPNPDGSSVDASRIIRADYANPVYAKLASEAVNRWRTTEWGADGRFTQSGLYLYVTKNNEGYGTDCCRKSYDSVVAIGQDKVLWVNSLEETVQLAAGYHQAQFKPKAAYVNWSSGWARAEDSIRYAKSLLDKCPYVTFVRGTVKQLLTKPQPGPDGRATVYGVALSEGDDKIITADLVMLATGAWSPALIDLHGRAEATGQSVAFISITDEEQDRLKDMPVMLDLGTGLFIIPPRSNQLRIARHGFGYRNPVRVPAPLGAKGANGVATMSVAKSNAQLPLEGEKACRDGLRVLCPDMADRPFVKTRVCWYTDTPNGDFIISYHPTYSGLFVATGGNGHGFKFLPIIGEKIVDIMEGKGDPELADLWGIKDYEGHVPYGDVGGFVCNDGSRAGVRGLILEEELAKQAKSKL